MNWRLKSSAFRLLSAVPGGENLYRLAQRHVTGSIIPTADRVRGKVQVALDYVRWLRTNGHAACLDGGTHFDFGAGWHPSVPLTFYASGVRTQRLLDLGRVMDAAGVAGTIRFFCEVAPVLAKEAGLELARLPSETSAGTPLDEQFRALGITYDAPCGDLLTRLGGQADFITSTQVLLHIDEPVLRECFRAIHHALKPGGLFLATIHLRPLYGGLEMGAAHYDHLTYSPEAWARFGSRIMSYSRLKAPDYRRLLGEAGFALRHFEIEPATPAELAAFDRTPIHPSFAHYSRGDLSARHLFFVAEKARA